VWQVVPATGFQKIEPACRKSSLCGFMLKVKGLIITMSIQIVVMFKIPLKIMFLLKGPIFQI